MSAPTFLMTGPCQPVRVQIAYPVETTLPLNNFIAYGYMTPSDVDKVWAWVVRLVNPQQRFYGAAVVAPPPFNWGFHFQDLPTLEPLLLVVEAEDVNGLTTRDTTHVLCIREPGQLEAKKDDGRLDLEICQPTSSVTRVFSALGIVSDVSVTMKAWVEQPAGTTLNPAGTRITPTGSQLYNWRFDFNITDNVTPGQAVLKVQAGTGSSAVTRQTNIFFTPGA